MSCKLNRRNFPSGSKVKLLKRQPLPEPADSPPCTGSTDSLESYLTAVHSATSRCNDDDFYWHHSTCESSALGQSSSSFMSWADDMELGMTQKMQQLLDEIDSSLYEENWAEDSLQPDQLQECEQWKEKFPHLRVVGRSLQTKQRHDDNVHVPAEVEEVIASHGCCEDVSRPASANCSGDRSDHSREDEDASRENVLQSMKDEVCAHVWSEVAKRLSEQTLQAPLLSPDARVLVANGDSSGSAKQSSGCGGGRESRARGQRARSLPRRVPLGALRATEMSDRLCARNSRPLDDQRCDTNGWKPLDRGKASSTPQRRSKWSKHFTLPPIENMQLTTKVTLCGRKSPGLFGEKTNGFIEHSYVDSMLLVKPKDDWRHHDISGGSRNSSPCKKSAKCRREEEKSSRHRIKEQIDEPYGTS